MTNTFEMKKAILTDSLKGSAKGGIYENLIADFLVKKGYPLYYFKRDDSSSEVEFLIEKECSVVPIEVTLPAQPFNISSV